MDTIVTINQSKQRFTKFSEAEDFILSRLRSWNNFVQEAPLGIAIEKVPSDTSTLGITVSDSIETKDLFGQP